LRLRPSVNRFLIDYTRRFPVHGVGGHWYVHSHLPPIGSAAYRRFVKLHLVEQVPGPSHAQIGVTAACPQDCTYCYNKRRSGQGLTTTEILETVDRLLDLGVVWLGFTGGEPLLQKDLARIVERAAPRCAVKLFTTGMGLTREKAEELAAAGLLSACVSLDHWEAAVHDANRRFDGAFAAALRAIATLREVDGLHVGVSSVLSREMLARGELTRLLAFLDGLGIHEVWLSEAKPSVDAFWSRDRVFGETERLQVCALQDEWNRTRGRDGMTVNYLGHFEGAETFGCYAGCKMVYVDAFGETSPCVFMPMTLGNVRERALADIVGEMRELMSCGRECWINRHYPLLQRAADGGGLLDRERSLAVLRQAEAAPPPAFERILRRSAASAKARV